MRATLGNVVPFQVQCHWNPLLPLLMKIVQNYLMGTSTLCSLKANNVLPSSMNNLTVLLCLNPLRSLESDIFTALTSLDASKAMGTDGTAPNILKSCALELCNPLRHLFQFCLETHTIPAGWRVYGITPVHKSGDRASATNYR